MRKNVLIIGGGLGGLAAACRLSARGFKVNLLEKNSIIGGKTAHYKVGDFLFQPVPCMITDIEPLVNLFRDVGRDIENYFRVTKLEPFYKVFFEDGRQGVYLNGDNSIPLLKMDNGDRVILTGDLYRGRQDSTINYVPQTGTYRRLVGKVRETLSRLTSFISTSSFTSIEQKLFTDLNDPFLSSAILAPLVFLGCDPGRISMRYAELNRLLFPKVMVYPLGSFHSVIAGLTDLLVELGGTIQYQAEVERILINRNKAAGVRLIDGRMIYADYVISDANRSYTQETLLKETLPHFPRAKSTKNIPSGPSVFILCFGMKSQYNDMKLCHHNFFISRGFSEMVRDVFNRNVFSTELFFYLQQPTLTDSSLAPMGGSVFQVIVPVPNLSANVDWVMMLSVYREQIIKLIEDTVIPNFRRDIAIEISFTPDDLAKQFSLPAGSVFRHHPNWFERMGNLPRVRTGIPNLFLVGDGSAPGWGINSVLEAARIADGLIPA